MTRTTRIANAVYAKVLKSVEHLMDEKRSHEKITRIKYLQIEIGRIWERKTTIMPIIVGTLGGIPSSLQTYMGLEMMDCLEQHTSYEDIFPIPGFMERKQTVKKHGKKTETRINQSYDCWLCGNTIVISNSQEKFDSAKFTTIA